MADLSGFPVLIQEALRTGRMPALDALALATGKSVEEIARELGEEGTDEDSDRDPEDPEAQAFRDKYHHMVAEMKAVWVAENVTHDNRVPAAELERIEYTCNRQIQHEWRRYQQRLTADTDADADQ